MIAAGGSTVAPCPHDLPCPLPADDWCHFAVRLPRSKLHRRAKGVELGYEDEKFSYAVLSRVPVPKAGARIIRQPQVRSGHVHLVTSEPDGIHQRTVSRKQGARFKQAKRAAWGDSPRVRHELEQRFGDLCRCRRAAGDAEVDRQDRFDWTDEVLGGAEHAAAERAVAERGDAARLGHRVVGDEQRLAHAASSRTR